MKRIIATVFLAYAAVFVFARNSSVLRQRMEIVDQETEVAGAFNTRMASLSLPATSRPLGRDNLPFIGAQVFIEPGQTPEQIDGWFATLKDAGMKVCRIRMFESYMRKTGGWDFSLFDNAFRSAEKHGIGIYCTLFPATGKTDIGGWKFPADEAQKASFAEFIRALVTHYKASPALKGWVLINEPGGGFSKTPFIADARKEWDRKHPVREFTENGYPVLMDLRDEAFQMDLNTEFLNWIAKEVTRIDPDHDIHVNPHGVFSNLPQYDFPEYRSFLTSLGGSAHPSWHFGYFGREDYCLAMLAQSELLRSGAGPLPWFMTEIQGGNNTYSGVNAFCPTADEIRQWLWAVIGCEGKGGIFWMLNPRSSGIEAGEWAMVDFQDRPSVRLQAASEVAQTLAAHPDVFSSLREIPSGIDILYFKEALWAEGKMSARGDRYEGRRDGAVIKSVLACFRALTEMGVNAGLKEFREYGFDCEDYSGKTIILPHQISVPEAAMPVLEQFVRGGGTLIVEGLTFFFDENLHARVTDWQGDFPENRVSEYILKDNLFRGAEGLPVHLWEGIFAGTDSNVAVERHGRGKLVWLPSCAALGARVTGDYQPLSGFLLSHSCLDGSAVTFDSYQKGLMLRSLETADGQRVLICINKSGKDCNVGFKGVSGKGEVLYACNAKAMENGTAIGNEGIIVLLFGIGNDY